MKTKALFLSRVIMILCCLSTLNIGRSTAQVTLGLDSVSFPDTVYTSSSYTVNFYVRNTGTLLFSGAFDLKMTVGTDSSVVASDSAVLPQNAIKIVTLNSFVFSPTTFPPGNDVVVVWPTGNGFVPSNYFTKTLHVIHNTGIAERRQEQQHLFDVYPNPSSGKLFLRMNEAFEQVRILNPLGEEVFRSQSSLFNPDVSLLPKGLYLVEVIFLDGSRSTKKLLIAQ